MHAVLRSGGGTASGEAADPLSTALQRKAEEGLHRLVQKQDEGPAAAEAAESCLHDSKVGPAHSTCRSSTTLIVAFGPSRCRLEVSRRMGTERLVAMQGLNPRVTVIGK
jgi:hypothetical protein